MSILRELAKIDPNVGALSLERNVGQHQAVLVGLHYARGKHVLVMDADLQDPPEAIPELLAKLEAGYAAAFGGRHGYYESILRMLTSRLFKLLLRVLCGLPTDAGLFVAMNPEMVKRLRVCGASRPSLTVMMAFTGLPLVSVPVTRIKRPRGQSAYSVLARLKFGMLTLRQVLRLRLSHGQELSARQVRIPVKAYVGARFRGNREDPSKRE
jgi:glycosyltransferase involved in cell wall biosynthesis